MKRAMGTILVLFCCTTLASANSVSGQLAMTPITTGFGPFSDNDNNGWAFTADSPFFVTGLSAYDVGANGFGGDMQVTLWSHSTQTLLASAIIPAAGDGTAWPTTAITPLALQAGNEYSVAAARIDLNAEMWGRWANSDVSFMAPVSGTRQVYGSVAGLFPASDGQPRDGFTSAGGNFTFTTSGAVPEPITLALFSLAACGLGTYVRRRV